MIEEKDWIELYVIPRNSCEFYKECNQYNEDSLLCVPKKTEILPENSVHRNIKYACSQYHYNRINQPKQEQH